MREGLAARWADVVTRWAVVILLGVTGVAVGCAVAGFGVAERLSTGGFDDPASESWRASHLLAERFDTGPANYLLVVEPEDPLESRSATRAAQRLARALDREPAITDVTSYWTAGRPPALRSRDGSSALVLARIGGDEDRVADAVEDLTPRYEGRHFPGLDVRVGGQAEVYSAATRISEADLRKAELIAFPVTFVALILVFGSLVAALLPLAVAAVTAISTLAVLRLIAALTPIHVFALNLTTALALGLAIDYSLLVVSRYREELGSGANARDALVATLQTAGRTIVFSSITVALSLSAMLVFPLYFLRSFAYASVAVTVLAGGWALVLLPALLVVLHKRVGVSRRVRRRTRETGTGRWAALASTVMAHPVRTGLPVVALLIGLGVPFLGVRFALPDDRILPADASAAAVHETLRQEYDVREINTLTVVAPQAPAQERPEQTDRYAVALSKVHGVHRVDAATGSYADGRQLAPGNAATRRQHDRADGTVLTVVTDVDAGDAGARELVQDIRGTPAPYDVEVTGEAARLVDTLDGLRSRLPLAIAIIALTTIVLLFLFTGSLLLPVKALVLNLLSLAATFGVLVLIFQDGYLRWLVGDFQTSGSLDVTPPILMFCVLFGLSMDYEMFLLSRIKEEWERSRDNRQAVAYGLQKSAGLITAAAVLITLVFLATATSEVRTVKLFGIGTALAIVLDATLVRAVLVPAFMRLAGRWNWWAPRPLRLLHARIGVSEAR